MRLDINLASQPYEDARQFWMRWGTALAVVSVLTIALLTITVSGWFAAQHDHARIAQLKAGIAQRDQKRQEAEAFLNQTENRSTRDQSQFLNELIERKSFSWTRVLEDLEKVMPARVHLVSIRPELDDDNQLSLKMLVAGDSRDRALELARRMEDSRRFNGTHIVTESFRPSPTGDPFQFDIVATYVPETVPEPAAKVETPAKTEISKRSAP